MYSILYVDDEPDLVDIARMYLEETGIFIVDSASTPRIAQEKMESVRYDAIISDYLMPGMDGIAFLKFTREQYGNIPFILFTGKGREEVVIDAVNNGADYYLQKGGDPDSLFAELIHKLRQAIQLRQDEKIIRANEQRLKKAQAIGHTGAWEYNFRTGMIWGSEEGMRIFGIRAKESEVPVEQIEACIPERKRVHQALLDLVSEGKEYNLEYVINPADGSPQRTIVSVAELERNAANKPVKVVGIFQDITDRKKMEEECSQNEARYRAIFENTGTAMVVIEENTVISLANAEFTALSGYTKEETEGKKRWTEFVMKEDLEDMLRQHQMRRVQRDTALKNYDFRFVTKSGAIRHIFLTIDIIAGTGKSVASLMDITEKKQAEEKITRQMSFLQQLLDTIPNPVFYKDTGGIYQGCNKAFEEYIGLKKAEILGKSVHDIYPHDLAEVYHRADNELFLHPGIQVYETLMMYHDGKKRPVIFNKAAYTNPDGSIGGLLGIIVDITDRKKAEDNLASTNRKLQLLSSITRHDILNKITVILAHIRVAKKRCDNPEFSQTLNKLESTTKEIRSHIEFSRIYQELGSHESRWQALGMILDRILIPEGITFTAKDTGFEIYADPMLEKVFYNLLDNAICHGGNVSAIRFSTEIRPGGLVMYWEDNGVGVPTEEKEQIFERGFGKQTGLGLFLCREILAISGITITETGSAGRGARFEIYVPGEVYRVCRAK